MFLAVDGEGSSWLARPANDGAWMVLSVGVLGSIAPRESSHDSDGAWRSFPALMLRGVRP